MSDPVHVSNVQPIAALLTVNDIVKACANKPGHEVLHILGDFLERLTSDAELELLRQAGDSHTVEHGRAIGAVASILAWVGGECEKLARSAPRKVPVPS